MTLSMHPPLSPVAEQRVLLSGVTWPQYESLLEIFGDRPGLRLLYSEGMLEIFIPSSEHEMLKKVISRLLERYAEEVDIVIHGYGSTTFRSEAKAQGLEPDECYCVDTLKEERPDFAIEINLMSGGIDKLAIYQGLGVPEVLIWQNNALALYGLRGEIYQEVPCSQFFPGLDFGLLAQYVQPYNQPQAVKAFLEAIRLRQE
ncbi:Uma2 family endonuclease [Altericista sp. CCNU0014]|uniref:Uma2 family endonuclease n=1 Tax=Altericista sp. CCNU0014 TaxID=3082949 RepID=UPI00384C7A52